MEMFDRECPTVDCLEDIFMSSLQAGFRGHYIDLFHCLNGLSEMVRTIVYWEATMAFVSLEGNRLVQRLQCNASSRVDVNGQSVQADKKSEKRKKVLGKGTSVLMQFITDTLQRGVGEVDDPSALLEK
ncbi:class II aaRS and biotin synthetases superfamily protein [Actinidia rufa]|uniref:Class II aaRS and biotin synthetases superfamily protein n=1 Tax=Actinidia rufa TaxID=165716 RepID=A0A7J0FNF1_9ERIC|nr:class II aaRS and biotin synthetases superfamily protein [Actinidia rufa]